METIDVLERKLHAARRGVLLTILLYYVCKNYLLSNICHYRGIVGFKNKPPKWAGFFICCMGADGVLYFICPIKITKRNV